MEYLKINITELENYPSNSLDNCFDIMHPLIRNLLLMIFASPPFSLLNILKEVEKQTKNMIVAVLQYKDKYKQEVA